jgi:2-oxoglutarate ferredoxin oxidoreductase subunit beta
VALNTPANLQKAKKAVKQAFEMQMNDMGFTIVELLSACPTNWGLTPKKSIERIEKELIPYFPLGVFKERKGTEHL